jgi:type I restriction enzyme, R subunit
MEHAVRHHIRKHLEEDPVKYGKLSERLQEILEQLDGQWKEQIAALSKLIQQLRNDAAVEGEALPDMPPHWLPFLRLLADAKFGKNADADRVVGPELMDATAEIVEIITDEFRIPGFWKPAHMPDQERLRGRLFEELFNRRVLPMARLDETVERLMELARANNDKLVNA